STALALHLRGRHPDRVYNYLCTPTGNEVPAMFAHWNMPGGLLGRRLLPVMSPATGGLTKLIRREGMIPNHRARFCARALKIEPMLALIAGQLTEGPVVHYVGLRADEMGRLGGVFDLPDVETSFPLREAGIDLAGVHAILDRHGVIIP